MSLPRLLKGIIVLEFMDVNMQQIHRFDVMSSAGYALGESVSLEGISAAMSVQFVRNECPNSATRGW